MKKFLITLLILLVGFTAFAGVESKLNVYGGTSYMVSHIGASYNLDQWEFGGTLYSAFPNMGIIGYLGDKDSEEPSYPNIGGYLGAAFTLGYAGTVSATYDLIESENVDLNLGFSIAGMYTEALEDLGIKGGVVSADTALKLQFNFGKHSGLYIATEVPLAGVLFLNQKDSSTGEVTNSANFFTVSMDGYLSAVMMLMLYTSRIGYIYRF